MPLTPQQLADFQRLRQSYAPVVEAQRRKQKAYDNLEKMHGLPPVKPQPKADGGSSSLSDYRRLEDMIAEPTMMEKATRMAQDLGQRGLDSVFPLRKVVRTGAEPMMEDFYYKSVMGDPETSLQNQNITSNQANTALFHIKNAIRNKLGMSRFPNKAEINTDDMIHNSFPDNAPQRKADGGSANLAQFLEGSHTPMRLYHGTTATEGGKRQEAIRRLKPSKEGAFGPGVYMTPDTEYASGYTGVPAMSQIKRDVAGGSDYARAGATKMLDRMNKGEVESHEVGGNMLPLHAKTMNPLVVDMVGPGDPNVMALMMMGVSKDKAYDIVEKAYEKQGGPGKHVYTRAKALGHDAMIIKRNGKVQEVIHYNPKMIKSATGNRGTYDTTKDDLSMAKGGKIEVRPTVFDDAASRRNPKIEEAARALLAGNIKQKDYERLVAKEKPVKPYSFIPKPATDEQAMDVLLDRQKQNWRSHEKWPAGHRVGLRLDIPAYERHGVWVNSVHDESGEKPVRQTSYGPVSSVRNAEFQGSPNKAARVATGELSKAPFARIMGDMEHIDEDQAVKHFQKYMNHPDYRQIGYDPRRHGDFYDRETMQPVTHSEHVVQIGPLVLAKKPKYGKRTVYDKGGEVNKAKFLKDSKVKDVLYHGTSNDITQFDTNRGKGLMLGAGAYFTPNVKKAESYAGDTKGHNATIMPVHVSLKNPVKTSIFDQKYMGSISDKENAKLRAKGHDGIILRNSDGSIAEVVVFQPHQIKSAIGNRGTYDPNDPDITKAKGGRVTHAHHLEIEERPL